MNSEMAYWQQNASRTCSTITFPRLTNYIIDFWLVFVVAVVISQTPFCCWPTCTNKGFNYDTVRFLHSGRLPTEKNRPDLPPTKLSISNKTFTLSKQAINFRCMHNRGQPALEPVPVSPETFRVTKIPFSLQ